MKTRTAGINRHEEKESWLTRTERETWREGDANIQTRATHKLEYYRSKCFSIALEKLNTHAKEQNRHSLIFHQLIIIITLHHRSLNTGRWMTPLTHLLSPPFASLRPILQCTYSFIVTVKKLSFSRNSLSLFFVYRGMHQDIAVTSLLGVFPFSFIPCRFHLLFSFSLSHLTAIPLFYS